MHKNASSHDTDSFLEPRSRSRDNAHVGKLQVRLSVVLEGVDHLQQSNPLVQEDHISILRGGRELLDAATVPRSLVPCSWWALCRASQARTCIFYRGLGSFASALAPQLMIQQPPLLLNNLPVEVQILVTTTCN